MARNELLLDLPITKPRLKSFIGCVADAFGIHTEQASAFTSSVESTDTLEDAGCLYLRLAMLHQDFKSQAVCFN